MRFPIYSQLVDNPDVPHLIDSFVPSFRAFHAANPALETIVYVGSPYTSPTVRALEGDADAWWGLMYETLIPLLEAGFTSIGFDASGSINIWKHAFDFELFELLMNPEARFDDPVRHAPLIEALGGDPGDPGNPGRPMTVYFEALPVNDRRNGLVDRAEAHGHNHMIITYEHYQRQDPDRRDEVGNPTVIHPSYTWNGERFGEMDQVNIILPNSSCRGTLEVGYQQVRAACLEEMRNVVTEQDRNAMADGNIRLLVNPRFLVQLDGNQVRWPAAVGSQAAETTLQAHATNANLDEFAQELNLAALPTRVDLDPNDDNPVGVEYTITRLPAHGSIAPSPYEDDVLVYTPDDGFKGTDYIEFKVSDGTHQATGRITLRVD
jgi:hypothetical protein